MTEGTLRFGLSQRQEVLVNSLKKLTQVILIVDMNQRQEVMVIIN